MAALFSIPSHSAVFSSVNGTEQQSHPMCTLKGKQIKLVLSLLALLHIGLCIGRIVYSRNTPEKLRVVRDQFGRGCTIPEPLINLPMTLHDLHPLRASVSLSKEAAASCMAIFFV